ncbi:hypothetical protein RJT34_19994 [Clitoria ternatea]|uniref:Uncharacterized protein n=1 Tax=Clitoria ternatea TaxID=43366 RepID=A0AAN9P4F9_CLITE
MTQVRKSSSDALYLSEGVTTEVLSLLHNISCSSSLLCLSGDMTPLKLSLKDLKKRYPTSDAKAARKAGAASREEAIYEESSHMVPGSGVEGEAAAVVEPQLTEPQTIEGVSYAAGEGIPQSETIDAAPK